MHVSMYDRPLFRYFQCATMVKSHAASALALDSEVRTLVFCGLYLLAVATPLHS